MFHSFRHFFNTQMAAAGIPGEIVRKTVGQVRGVQFTLTRGVSLRRQG